MSCHLEVRSVEFQGKRLWRVRLIGADPGVWTIPRNHMLVEWPPNPYAIDAHFHSFDSALNAVRDAITYQFFRGYPAQ